MLVVIAVALLFLGNLARETDICELYLMQV